MALILERDEVKNKIFVRSTPVSQPFLANTPGMFYKIKIIDSKQDENCHKTSNSFHGSNVQIKVVMNEKRMDAALDMVLVDRIKKALIDSFYLGTRPLKQKSEKDGTFLMYVVYGHHTANH